MGSVIRAFHYSLTVREVDVVTLYAIVDAVFHAVNAQIDAARISWSSPAAIPMVQCLTSWPLLVARSGIYVVI